MAIFVAFLRGINVGGRNKIKMANLKRMFESIGFKHVETYIQSGNVLFESDETEDMIRMKIENEMKDWFGFSSFVVLRTAAELEQIIKKYPFSKKEIAKAEALNTVGESLYVNLLVQAPGREESAYLNAGKGDQYEMVGRDVYLLFHHGIRKSKLAGSLNKLDTPGTIRNWKTISKLFALTESRTHE